MKTPGSGQLRRATPPKGLIYPASIRPDGSRWLVTFPDIPEAITGGRSQEKAAEMARDALVTALESYFESKRAIPAPSRLRKGQVAIALPAAIAAKVVRFNESLATK